MIRCYFHLCLMRSAAFSPTIIVGAMVFPDTELGIMDASATLRFLIPFTLQKTILLLLSINKAQLMQK